MQWQMAEVSLARTWLKARMILEDTRQENIEAEARGRREGVRQMYLPEIDLVLKEQHAFDTYANFHQELPLD